MTPRENLLSLYRRQGYEFAPVEYILSPAMREKQEAAVGSGKSAAEYFEYVKGFVRCGVPAPPLIERPEPDWRHDFDQELHPETNFSSYGVAREGGCQGAWHLHRMHHPMAGFDSVE